LPLDRRRYRPAQWDDNVRWQRYRASGERWLGFECVRDLAGLPPEILIVPLGGHTVGHAGIAIHGLESWLLHAGDAYFYRGEMDPRGYRCTPMLRVYQRLEHYRFRLHRHSRESGNPGPLFPRMPLDPRFHGGDGSVSI
jgi:glyoxylase-like metal-dependent hydrolase (beta-lactamase superfamily II)